MKIIDEYYDYLCGRSISETTRLNYTKFPKTFLNYIKKQANDITQLDIDEYVRYCILNRKHNGNGTRFRCLKYFFNWLGKNFELPMLSMKETDKAVLNQQQIQRLFDTVKDMSYRHQLIFYLEYDGIRRPGEIRNLLLDWRHDDLLYYTGKTHKSHIIMTDRLMKAWDNYVDYERPKPKTANDALYLLLNINRNTGIRGTHLRTPEPLLRVIRDIFYEADVDVPMGENPTNYLIKRSSITRQLKTCPDPKIIQLQAGHSNLAITMRYNRVSDDDRRDYFNGLNEVYKNKPKPELQDKNVDYVLKTNGELSQSLNKTIEENNNSSYSFSLFFSDSLNQLGEIGGEEGRLPGLYFIFNLDFSLPHMPPLDNVQGMVN